MIKSRHPNLVREVDAATPSFTLSRCDAPGRSDPAFTFLLFKAILTKGWLQPLMLPVRLNYEIVTD